MYEYMHFLICTQCIYICAFIYTVCAVTSSCHWHQESVLMSFWLMLLAPGEDFGFNHLSQPAAHLGWHGCHRNVVVVVIVVNSLLSSLQCLWLISKLLSPAKTVLTWRRKEPWSKTRCVCARVCACVHTCTCVGGWVCIQAGDCFSVCMRVA